MFDSEQMRSAYSSCQLCPRRCGANRLEGDVGYCGVTSEIRAARAALHMWEEPCISGVKLEDEKTHGEKLQDQKLQDDENTQEKGRDRLGSGAVFFTGCNLRCVFCQNYEISQEKSGLVISPERLVEIYFELKEKGANNINLVTSDIYAPTVVKSLEEAKRQGLDLPVVFNSSSYLEVDTLKMFEGLVDIYLPDFKYWDKKKAAKYSGAEDYPEVAKRAIAEMVRQVRNAVSEEDRRSSSENHSMARFNDRGIMQRGVIVRHLLMPHGLLDAKMVVKYLYMTYGDDVYISLMNQYTPRLEQLKDFPELQEHVTGREYDELIDYAAGLGVKNGFMQTGETAKESFIPAFNYEGVER